jgi:hypothetical protein
MNFFSFSALALDVLGTVLMLISARILFKTANEPNFIRKAKFSVCDTVWNALNATRLGDTKCCNIPDDLRRLLYILDNALDCNKSEVIFVVSGGAFFLVSLFILLITTQHVAVWVTVMVLMIVVPAWLWVNGFASHPSIWGELPVISGMARRMLRGVV